MTPSGPAAFHLHSLGPKDSLAKFAPKQFFAFAANIYCYFLSIHYFINFSQFNKNSAKFFFTRFLDRKIDRKKERERERERENERRKGRDYMCQDWGDINSVTYTFSMVNQMSMQMLCILAELSHAFTLISRAFQIFL